jgi:hypothetical protein
MRTTKKKSKTEKNKERPPAVEPIDAMLERVRVLTSGGGGQ